MDLAFIIQLHPTEHSRYIIWSSSKASSRGSSSTKLSQFHEFQVWFSSPDTTTTRQWKPAATVSWSIIQRGVRDIRMDWQLGASQFRNTRSPPTSLLPSRHLKSHQPSEGSTHKTHHGLSALHFTTCSWSMGQRDRHLYEPCDCSYWCLGPGINHWISFPEVWTSN